MCVVGALVELAKAGDSALLPRRRGRENLVRESALRESALRESAFMVNTWPPNAVADEAGLEGMS